MKSIYEVFEDKEFAKLQRAKGKRTWREFILTLMEDGEWTKQKDRRSANTLKQNTMEL